MLKNPSKAKSPMNSEYQKMDLSVVRCQLSIAFFGTLPIISHRAHREHRVLIWIAERVIQIKLRSNCRCKFAFQGLSLFLFVLLNEKK